jgi:hypothetical protein
MTISFQPVIIGPAGVDQGVLRVGGQGSPFLGVQVSKADELHDLAPGRTIDGFHPIVV